MSKFNKPNIEPHVPNKYINPGDVSTLFTIVQDRNSYNKLIRYVSDHNNTFRLQNDDGDNVIHMILKNDSPDISEDHQLRLIKFFADQGVSISTFNKLNEPPLHLAAKYQKPDIVKYFLEKGVDPNVTTNQGMTPLHLAIHGIIKPCKEKRTVGDIISKPTIKMHNSLSQKNIQRNILDILESRDFKKYIEHMQYTLKNIQNIYKYDTDKFVKKFNQEFKKIINS